MAALGQYLVTLADVAKSKDRAIGSVAEILVQENPMLNDVPYMQMNEGTIHKESIRSSLPSVYYRKANQPIPPGKTTIEERTFQAAHFESKSQMDEAVAKRGGVDRIAFNRWNQAQGHIQAAAIEHANLMIYGSPTVGTSFTTVGAGNGTGSNLKTAGLCDIYCTTNSAEETSLQIIDGGGTDAGDMTSIWRIHWGDRSVFGIYPAGTQAGLKRTDRSAGGKLVPIQGTDLNGNYGNFWGFEEQFEVDHGLVVKDFRQASRVANIDIAALNSGVSAADLITLMIDAHYKIHNLQNGVGVWYVNRTIEAFLHQQSLTKVGAGAGLTYDNFDGKKILMFLGFPVRRADALLNTENQVTSTIPISNWGSF